MTTATLPASPPPGAAGSLREAWLITIGHSLTHWYPATFYLLLPLIGAELGLSYSQIGLIMTCQYIAQAVANIPGGVIVDTVGRKGVLMAISLFWIGFPYLLMSFAHSYWLMAACIAMVGFGNSIWHPTAIPTLAERFPTKKGLVLSIHGMGGSAGDAIAPLVIGSLLAIFTWREVVVMNVVPGLIVALVLLVFLGTMKLDGAKAGDKPKQNLAEYGRGLAVLTRDRAVMVLSLSSAFRSMTQNALLTFLPLYLARELGYSTIAIGTALFVLQVAGFAAAPLAGALSDKLGPQRVVNTTMAMTAVVFFAMAFAGKSQAFIVFIALLGFFLYATRPVIQAWLMDTTPKNMAGSSIGIMFSAQAVGSSIGPLIGGVLADRYGLASTFYFLAVTIMLGNLVLLAMPRGAMVAKRY